jgi:glucose-1-phosphate cytidylyltransferase
MVSMKVVILAGGLGTRMREETEFRPKPMVEIGGKPAIWHLMKLYANYGHTEFVICAGYKGEQIKNYFYNYRPQSLDFTINLGEPNSVEFHGSHNEFDWKVTVVDTGLGTPTGGRVRQVENYLGGETFMCSYGDSISPVLLEELIAAHRRGGKTGTVTVTRPRSRFGVVQVDDFGAVLGFEEKPVSRELVSIGHFVFEPEIFDFLEADSVLEEEPLRRLAKLHQLSSFEHQGFWQPMDTAHEFQALNVLFENQKGPWVPTL